jgi:hypothetical protein
MNSLMPGSTLSVRCSNRRCADAGGMERRALALMLH